MENLDLAVIESWMTEERINTALGLALNAFSAIIIIIFALIVSGWVKTRITRIAARYPRLDPTLFSFLANIAKYIILVFAAIFVLNRFGFQTTSLAALIGAMGLAIGLALQGALGNLAAGVMIILFRPFRVGDSIDAAGQSGTVIEIALFFTELRTYDGLQVIVPNGDIWAKSIKNYSNNTVRMIDLNISISYGSDLKLAQKILLDIANSDARVLQDPAPSAKVKELGAASVILVFRVWTSSADWGSTKCDINENIKLRFDEAGVDIPFPAQPRTFQ